MKQKSKNNPYSSVDESLNNGVKKGIFHLNAHGDVFDGRTIYVNDKKIINFGSCSYLGLEIDDRLKQGAIDATIKYGSQFSSSRAYISCGLYEELEHKISSIFGGYALVGQSTSLVHIATIPVVVDDNDAVILDHQVHGSIQNAVQLIKSRGVTIDIIRHSNLEMLEDRIKKLRNSHYRIWYMVDGVYSMYGDYAPIHELFQLMDKYPQLHIYVDDAHGMSWAGKNGSGYILSQIPLHPKMIFTTSLNKAFAGCGGTVVSLDKELIRKIKTCGSSFVFSGPIQPPMLGASIASADIHLSSEIYSLQNQLKEKVSFCHELIKSKNLPYILPSGSPMFYLALGLPNVGYDMIKRLMNDGFYTDIGIFPGVPLKRTGIRLPITNNHTQKDIENIVNAIEYHYPYVLKSENQTINDLEKHFRMDFSHSKHLDIPNEKKKSELIIETYNSITEIEQSIWNNQMEDCGSFDWNGCNFLETVFVDNPEPESNWEFHYLIIKDKNDQIILSTFFTILLCKDDMLSPTSVSEQIEQIRLNDPYYMTSKIIMMGSLLTEGDHLYIDKSTEKWKEALILLIENIQEIQDKSQANAIYLRDFDTDDLELRDFFINQGFFRIDMPDVYILEKPKWKTNDEFLNNLSGKYRFHQRKEVIPYEKYYDVKIIEEANDLEIEYWYKLYSNIKKNKLKLNTFDLPKKIFKQLLIDNNWIILELKLKKEYQADAVDTPLSICFIHKSKNNISPIFLGLDYDYLGQYKPYRQNLFQVIKQGIKLDVDKIYLGMEASLEKSRFGASAFKKSAYIQTNESYDLERLNIFAVTK